MDNLVIQDVFDPYYAGRRSFLALRVREISIVRTPADAGPEQEGSLTAIDSQQAAVDRSPAGPKEH